MDLCPHCGLETKSGTSDNFLACTVCGMVYSRFGAERRREGRLKVSKACSLTLTSEDAPLVATVGEISLNGARVVYPGNSLMTGGTVYFDVNLLDLHTPAKVMWTAPLDNDRQNAGLRLIWSYNTVGAVDA